MALLAVYANHFDNGFYFDDYHTIVENEAIRDLSQWPRFFVDISTFGTMPENRGYRPVVTLLNAIDFALAGGRLDPRVFHLSIFLSYLALGVVLWRFTRELFRRAQARQAELGAFLGTAFYLFHTANAETINYIISRSDSFSTLCVVATLMLYQEGLARRYFVYLVPLVIGLLTKEVVVTVVPLLWLYTLFFELRWQPTEMTQREGWKKLGTATLSALPVALVGVGMTLFSLLVMGDPNRLSGGLPHSRWDYFTTQFVVVAHYLKNFVLPVGLSADPDFRVSALWSGAKVAGLAILLLLSAVGVVASTRRSWQPVSFGIAWFFLTLAPTSSFNPMHQVANDHRTFLPYIGLTLAVGWLVSEHCSQRNKRGLIALCLLILLGHAYGTFRRNQVWDSDELLWGDAVLKYPNNGRALMNYGLVFLKRGEFLQAERLFQRALAERPTWTYSHINMAIVQGELGRHREAEEYFRAALQYGRNNPEPYLYYARWLSKRGRAAEALEHLKSGLEVSPKHVGLKQFRRNLEQEWERETELLEQRIAQKPTAADLVQLSLLRYQKSDYQGCLEACRRALLIDPREARAYNNICSAYIKLEMWPEAVRAGEQAVKMDPEFDLAQNNLDYARARLNR